jgi:hypothetical protein
MIQLTGVVTQGNLCLLTFIYDYLEEQFEITINAEDLVARLKTVKAGLGRPMTIDDLKMVIIQLFNEIREGKATLTEMFDYTELLNIDLEAV